MKIKISDYIAAFLVKKNMHNIFGVTGGGAMHLNNSFAKNKKLKFVRVPKFEEVPYPIVMEPNLVIEYYSR